MNEKYLTIVCSALRENKYIGLELGKQKLTPEQLKKLIEALKINSSLSWLDLSSNQLKDDAIIMFLQFLANVGHPLQQINFSENYLTSDGKVKALAAKENNPCLTTLILHGNPCELTKHVVQQPLDKSKQKKLADETKETKLVDVKDVPKVNMSEEIYVPPITGYTGCESAGEGIFSYSYEVIDNYFIFQEELGYKFASMDLLYEALTRKSYYEEGTRVHPIKKIDNKRLEFLGDSILRTAIDDLLLEMYPNEDTDFLSQKRDQWVSKKGFIYLAAQKLDLASYARMAQNERDLCCSEDQGKYTILNSLMESIIGAVFIDSNRDYAKTKLLIAKITGFSAQQLYKDQQLFKAVQDNNLTEVKHWLEQKADPNKEHDCECPASQPQPSLLIDDKNPVFYCSSLLLNLRNSALCLAIRQYNIANKTPAIVEMLLKNGARPNRREGTSLTPLLYDTITKREKSGLNIFSQLTGILCRYGADPNERGYQKEFTAFELAIFQGNYQTIKILLENKADVNLKGGSKERSPLHWAVIHAEYCANEYDKYCATQYVNEKYPKFFKSNNLAAVKRYAEIIALLIKCGAKLNVVDKQGLTPLEYAKTSLIKNKLTIVPQITDSKDSTYDVAFKADAKR